MLASYNTRPEPSSKLPLNVNVIVEEQRQLTRPYIDAGIFTS
jgi:hypothetical protein